MRSTRRKLLQTFSWTALGACFAGLSGATARVGRRPEIAAPTEPQERLAELLEGTWEMQSYTYASNNRTYLSPEEMEARATFFGDAYEVEFVTHISAMGMERTRRASESGTYSVEGNTIRLFADEASSEAELGEELLLEAHIEDDTLTLLSNNRSNTEVWRRAS